MARLLGPDENSRLAYVVSSAGALKAMPGRLMTVYADAVGTQLANVAAYQPTNPTVPGATIVGSVLTIDAYSKLPLFWFPDGADTVYVTVNGGPLVAVYANLDSRLDSLAITAGDGLTGGGSLTGGPEIAVDFGTTAGTVADGKVLNDLGDTVTNLSFGTDPNRIVSLITGTDDETLVGTSLTVSADATNFIIGTQGWKVTAAGAGTGHVTQSAPVPPAASGMLTVPPAQSVCMWVYIPDATKVTSVQVFIFQNTGNTITWTRSTTSTPVQTLVNGWNLLRWKAMDGMSDITTWGNVNRIDIYVTTSAATNLTIGHMYLECPPKARMVFILDRGYKSFVSSGALARVRAAGVPVTWALDVALLGTSVGLPAEVVTEAEIASYAALGDSISFHGWDGSVTSSMTAAQVRADTAKAIKWLQSRGYGGRLWRAAWVQNLATNAAAVNNMVVALATSTSNASLDTWPPRNRWDIPRQNFYGKTTSQVDTQFQQLQATNGLYVIFNHGIDQVVGNDATAAEFDYWMTKVEAALAAGWLEATTFEALWKELGAQTGDFAGGTTTRVPVAGALTTAQTL